jgi:hypothetical protein
MKHLICKRLARMASTAAQDRYVSHGTTDSYYLPEELLADAMAAVDLADKLPSAERGTVEAFGRALRQNLPAAQSMPAFLSPVWLRIREAARACLDELGFDLDEWEQRELSE